MKKLIAPLILALVLILTPTCLFAANFVEIYNDDRDSVFLDTSSIQDKGTYYQVWTKWVLKGEEKKEASKKYKKEVEHYMFLTAYTKKAKQFCSLATYIYDKDGQVINSFSSENYPISWENVIPDSVGDIIIDAVYKYTNN